MIFSSPLHHVFLNILPSISVPADVAGNLITELLAPHQRRLRELHVGSVEVKLSLSGGAVRSVISNETGLVSRQVTYFFCTPDCQGKNLF